MRTAALTLGITPQNVVLFHHFRRFLECASKKAIDVAPLKGAHLLTSVYPDGEDRGLLADVDFLVRPADWKEALSILREMGFRGRPATRRPVSDAEYHETAYYLEIDGGDRIMFEPHRFLAPPARLRIDYAALWQRSTVSEFDGAPCRRLSNDDHFLHTVVHMVSHSFLAPSRSLRDMALLIDRGGVSLDRVIAEVDVWGIRNASWLALSMLEEQLPGTVDARYLRSVRPAARVRRYLRWLVPSPSGFRLPKLGLRGQQLVLWPALFDSARHYFSYTGYYARLRIRDAVAWRSGHW